MSIIFVSQELIDDAGGFEVPGGYVGYAGYLMAIVAFDYEYPGIARTITVERPGWRPRWHRLVCRLRHSDDKDLRGWEFKDTPEWTAFLQKYSAA